MQRIQVFQLLIGCGLVVALSGCFGEDPKQPGASGKPLSVSDYLHDIDKARARVHRANIDGAAALNDPDALNASAAVAKSMSPSINKCWPVKPSITENTDHDCLDKLGFVRS